MNTRFDNAGSLLTDIIKSNPQPTFEKLSEYSSRLPRFYSLYVFNDRSLIYWSDNSLNPEISITDSLIKKRIHKAGNGIYQIAARKSGTFTFIMTDLIKSGYSYQNEYLSPAYNPAYTITSGYEIIIGNKGIPVNDRAGKTLFSLYKNEKIETTSSVFILIQYLLYLTGFILLVIAIYMLYLRITPLKKYPLLIVLFIFDVFLMRALLIYFRIPSSLYTSELFSPISFAYSSFLPSLGDFFTDALISSLVFFLTYRSLKIAEIKPLNNRYLMMIIQGLLTITAVFFYYFGVYLLNVLINNSSFSLNLSNTTEFSLYSLMAYFIIAFILSGYFFISYALYGRIVRISGWKTGAISFVAVNLGFFALAQSMGFYAPQGVLLLLQCIYFICLMLIFTKIIRFPDLTSLSILVLLFTLISSYSLYINKSQKEKNERKLIALRLSSDRDKMGEFMFAEIEKLISTDTTLNRLYREAWADPGEEAHCIDYIRGRYLKGYWSVYNIQITLCFPEKSLQIRPSNYIIGCRDYFRDIITRLGEPTSSSSLYFIRESYDASSYIANIPMSAGVEGQPGAFLVIELSPKYVPKGLGYPELLMDQTNSSRTDISDYSYAVFFRNELVKNVGEYNFGVNEIREKEKSSDFNFYDKNGYNHLHHDINKDTCIVISKKNEGLLDKLSPITYQLIFHIILFFIAFGIYNLRKAGQKRSLDFKTRLQLMVVVLVLFASFSVGVTTLINIRNLNDKKNRDMLSEKAHSVLIELEHKLATMDIIDKSQKSFLEELLTKFSLVFFSDINLYDINGRLLASSRPQIFEEGLKSELMGPGPFTQLVKNKRTLFIDNEKIGNYEYLSAYLPFRNEQNKLTAYINLPYFAREQELRQEISAFLVAFVNIYVILTILAVLISVLAGNYLMRPLQLIRNRFSILNLGQTNEKISYTRKDELGDLINEYNLMVDKLADSAEKLARSERESAWREMARQVAHEIKNPLTPMKLSIQHLSKSWDDKTPDWESRLTKTTQTLIEQIDSLAAIASAFSDFAKLPSQSNKKTDLTSVIRKTIALFNQHPEINFSFTLPDKQCHVFADEKQLSRVFINLFNNAVQAIPQKSKGLISIKLTTVENIHRIEISDNGTGIDEEKKAQIFSPNFTTKSGGMGLGLAMVKNIVDNTGGEISFISKKGTGTTFIIELPVMAE
ncbi:MAG: ATP-binding protein [Bacteroidota bacterium]